MKRIYITGMSGTGKSSLIEKLSQNGFTAIDTDYGNWKIYSEIAEEWILDETKLQAVILAPADRPIFISGCCSNQTKFYQYFDHKVLLSASLAVILERVTKRSSNNYGQTEQDRAEITWNYNHIQPLLRKDADLEFDTEIMNPDQIAAAVMILAKSE